MCCAQTKQGRPVTSVPGAVVPAGLKTGSPTEGPPLRFNSWFTPRCRSGAHGTESFRILTGAAWRTVAQGTQAMRAAFWSGDNPPFWGAESTSTWAEVKDISWVVLREFRAGPLITIIWLVVSATS